MKSIILSHPLYLSLTSSSSVALISILFLLTSFIFFVIALWNFHKAARSKLVRYYAKAFIASGHGFIALGLLQLFLRSFLDSEHRQGAFTATVFFLAVGVVLSIIGNKIKPKTERNE